MKFKYYILSALLMIRAHKVRSFLTILGIMIGIASIIAVMSIGQGASRLILTEIDQLGADMAFVIPGQIEGGFTDLFFVDPLTQDDLETLKIKRNVPNLKDIMPIVAVPGAVSYRDKTYQQAITMGGSAIFFGETFNIQPIEGTYFTDSDVKYNERVAIIGDQVKTELFGQSTALEEKINIGGQRFKVIGIYEPKGQVGPINMDDLILIPYTTAQTYITGTDNFEEFHIRVDSLENMDRMVFDITATLRQTRGVKADEEDDFTVMTQEGYLEMVSEILLILNAFLIFIVSISLLVGGIGIMNIMLVSVTERTKEIGLRKALGATKKAILKQFLWEAIILTVLGGVIGILIGTTIAYLGAKILTSVLAFSWPFTFPVTGTLLGLLVSAVVGLLFGLFPAKQAANKDPIEALQYEK